MLTAVAKQSTMNQDQVMKLQELMQELMTVPGSESPPGMATRDVALQALRHAAPGAPSVRAQVSDLTKRQDDLEDRLGQLEQELRGEATQAIQASREVSRLDFEVLSTVFLPDAGLGILGDALLLHDVCRPRTPSRLRSRASAALRLPWQN